MCPEIAKMQLPHFLLLAVNSTKHSIFIRKGYTPSVAYFETFFGTLAAAKMRAISISYEEAISAHWCPTVLWIAPAVSPVMAVSLILLFDLTGPFFFDFVLWENNKCRHHDLPSYSVYITDSWLLILGCRDFCGEFKLTAAAFTRLVEINLTMQSIYSSENFGSRCACEMMLPEICGNASKESSCCNPPFRSDFIESAKSLPDWIVYRSKIPQKPLRWYHEPEATHDVVLWLDWDISTMSVRSFLHVWFLVAFK